MRALRGKMRRAHFNHATCANQQYALARWPLKNALRKSYRSGCDGNRMRADLALSAHRVCGGKSMLEQAVQIDAKRARIQRSARRRFQLAENLRLSQYHRIQSGGDAEDMADCTGMRKRVQMRRQFTERNLAAGG